MNGEVTLTASGLQGSNYDLEDSVDLMNWSTVEANEQIIPLTGEITFTDIPTAQPTLRFYRIVEELQ